MNLNIELTNDEIAAINDLYLNFKQTEKWGGVRTVNHKFGRALLEKILFYYPPLIRIQENSTERKSIYQVQ